MTQTFRSLALLDLGPFIACLGCFEPVQYLSPSPSGLSGPWLLVHGGTWGQSDTFRAQGSGLSKTAVSFGPGKKILANNGLPFGHPPPPAIYPKISYLGALLHFLLTFLTKAFKLYPCS